jgi:hypothetical protein
VVEYRQSAQSRLITQARSLKRPYSFHQFTKLRSSPVPPLDPPSSLPPTPTISASTVVPSLDDLLDQIDDYRERLNLPTLVGSESGGHELDGEPAAELENRYWGDGLYELRGGETVAQDALRGYLRFLVRTALVLENAVFCSVVVRSVPFCSLSFCSVAFCSVQLCSVSVP